MLLENESSEIGKKRKVWMNERRAYFGAWLFSCSVFTQESKQIPYFINYGAYRHPGLGCTTLSHLCFLTPLFALSSGWTSYQVSFWLDWTKYEMSLLEQKRTTMHRVVEYEGRRYNVGDVTWKEPPGEIRFNIYVDQIMIFYVTPDKDGGQRVSFRIRWKYFFH